MAFYNNFWTLKSSTSYTTHTVGQFDANCSSGGGVFKWVSANNTSVSDIAGFRIKPSAVTTGYWERVYDGPINVGWFGTQNTTSIPPFKSIAPIPLKVRGFDNAELALNLIVADPAVFWRGRF